MLFDKKPPIAVLDSGIGGLKLAKCLNINTCENIIYFADSDYMPYGKKSRRRLLKRLDKITSFLINNFNIKVLIIACNTASVIGLEYLRSKYNIPIFGVFPETKMADLIICTKLTKSAFKDNNIISLPRLASVIEEYYFNQRKLENEILKLGKKHKFNQLKTILLGCTHYELIENIFKHLFPNIEFICPTNETVKQILSLNLLITGNESGHIYIMSSLPSKSNIEKLYKIFENLDVPTFFA